MAYAGVVKGTDYEYVNANSELYAYQTWNQSTKQMGIFVRVQTTLGTGYCVDSWFDWNTESGGTHYHYDSRGVRDCQNNATESSGTVTDTQIHGVNGMNKAGGAWGPDNDTTTDSWWDAPNALMSINGISPVMNSSTLCSEYWKRNSNGTTTHGTGGNPLDCKS